MRETMLHFDEVLTEDARKRLCSALREEGVNCDAAKASNKPHLLFLAYDQSHTAPHDLTRIAARAGFVARLVDL